MQMIMGKGLDNFLNCFSEDRDELGGSGRCQLRCGSGPVDRRAARPAQCSLINAWPSMI